MTPAAARRFAERVHADAADRYGLPLLDHVRRVASAVPAKARTVAWLHEVLECSNVSKDELRAAGATEDELVAVELLTRVPGADAGVYQAHIARIASARGRAGELARAVKHADLSDRLEHQAAFPATPVQPPYQQALNLLAGHCGRLHTQRTCQ